LLDFTIFDPAESFESDELDESDEDEDEDDEFLPLSMSHKLFFLPLLLLSSLLELLLSLNELLSLLFPELRDDEPFLLLLSLLLSLPLPLPLPLSLLLPKLLLSLLLSLGFLDMPSLEELEVKSDDPSLELLSRLVLERAPFFSLLFKKSKKGIFMNMRIQKIIL